MLLLEGGLEEGLVDVLLAAAAAAAAPADGDAAAAAAEGEEEEEEEGWPVVPGMAIVIS